MAFLIIFITFWGMEFMAWFTHKYVMHGFLWSVHEDHHTHNKDSFFEKNDAFFLIYAVPSWLCIMLGSMFSAWIVMNIGFGILAYGIAYFLVHEIFIHQRLKWFKNSNNSYLRAIRRAHKIHHKHLGKEKGACFGMLVVPLKYLKQELKQAK
ncbi:beta carotene hydroxylase [Polaribacter irgensii 23-P]|jgi:beta-carotene 3-hydroxylase|uniref:Beta carotene hydroxylase n=1 Tax=Polaribacter irgensii 23-P TaxID=313594 RepID=A4C1L4_9FLAO|nr:sterol desaturase family protein [Polaribacter irgensii]EAR12017.1 beta carotene hydroxylase [Polaribacter irgensii 23-P]